MEKVFEARMTKPLAAVYARIDERIIYLNRKYDRQRRRFRISYAWNARSNMLLVQNKQYGITVTIEFTLKKIIGRMEVPLWMRPLAWIYKDRILSVVLAEVNGFLKIL